jgi:DNA-directed RNA polymerase sigma subunit (sigma70/sigma32)
MSKGAEGQNHSGKPLLGVLRKKLPPEARGILSDSPDQALVQRVRDAVATLLESDAGVLTRRLNLDGNGYRTQQQTAVEMGYENFERVAQIENRALRKLRRLLEADPQPSSGNPGESD